MVSYRVLRGQWCNIIFLNVHAPSEEKTDDSKDKFMSMMFSHRNIHKYTWTSPDGKIHNQIDHILIDRRWHSSILDVRSFRGADCDPDHYLVVVKVRERLAVGKQGVQMFDSAKFILRNLNELEVRKQYQTEISNRFGALENLSDSEDINRTCENIKENTKTQGKENWSSISHGLMKNV